MLEDDPAESFVLQTPYTFGVTATDRCGESVDTTFTITYVPDMTPDAIVTPELVQL